MRAIAAITASLAAAKGDREEVGHGNHSGAAIGADLGELTEALPTLSRANFSYFFKIRRKSAKFTANLLKTALDKARSRRL